MAGYSCFGVPGCSGCSTNWCWRLSFGFPVSTPSYHFAFRFSFYFTESRWCGGLRLYALRTGDVCCSFSFYFVSFSLYLSLNIRFYLRVNRGKIPTSNSWRFYVIPLSLGCSQSGRSEFHPGELSICIFVPPLRRFGFETRQRQILHHEMLCNALLLSLW